MAARLLYKGEVAMRREDRNLIINNNEIYSYYRERIINICLSMFEWHGLPETMDRLWLEKSLLYNGKVAAGKVAGTDIWLGLDYVYKGHLDVYGYPTDIRLVPATGQNGLIEVDEFQLLFDNMTFVSLMPKIHFWAKQLWKVHNTFNSNLDQQITPYLIPATRNESLGIKNLFNRIMGFQPVIEVKNSFDPSSITTLDTRVDFKGLDMLEALKICWAECLSMLGVTAETTKKERLLNDEITIDRQEDILSLNSRLLNRVDFCNKMNKKYGFNLSVNLSSNDLALNPYPGDMTIQTMDELGVDGSRGTSDNTSSKGGEDNG